MNFKRSVIKLTAGYLLIIMLVSGLLSLVLYKVATSPLERRLEFGERILREDVPPPYLRPGFEPLAVREVKRRTAILLVYLNIGVFFLAGILSYALARRELKPMEVALDLQSRFTSDAAHELRTPLTVMKTEIEVTLRSGEIGPGETRDLLESNLEEIGKLEALSASLLKLARYEGSAQKTEMTAVELAPVTLDAVARLSRAAAAKEIGLYVDADEGLVVSGDRVSLVEMLVILLDNSVKYSNPGTSVAVSIHGERGSALIHVRDQGFGIRGQDLEHVFDRFYRGSIPVSKGQVEGFGLGLSIAKRIAEIHRGDISLASVPGMGTTVTVKLPLVRRA